VSDLQVLLSRLTRRDRVLLAMLACSLGMSWALTSELSAGAVIPGWFVPDSYVNVTGADGYMYTETIPGFIGAPIFLPGSIGYENASDHPARFGVAAAIFSILASAWFADRRLQILGGLILVVTTAMTAGLGFAQAGSSIGWIAGTALIALEMPAIRARLPSCLH
jgi:hypothetical protein